MTRVMAGLTVAGHGQTASVFEIESSSHAAEDLDFATSIAKTGSVSGEFERAIATSITMNFSGKTACVAGPVYFAMTTSFAEEDADAVAPKP